jgi:hypothetical protein
MIEREFNAGRLGITDQAEVESLTDIFKQTPDTDFQFPDTQADRLERHQCPYCQTAFRTSDLREPDADRCPFCHRMMPI